MAQATYETQWQHNPFSRPKKDPLTPDDDARLHAPQYTYNLSPQSRLDSISPQSTNPPPTTQFPIQKDGTYLYQYQGNPNPTIIPGTAPGQPQWDSYLAWDDSETWAPVPDVTAEEYAGALSVTQAPNYSWDWNAPPYTVPSQGDGFVDRSALQQSPPNPSMPMHNNFDVVQPLATVSLADSTASWPVQKHSPESMPSLDSAIPSHRTSVERSPPQYPDRQYHGPRNPPKSSKSHSSSSSEADNHSNSSNSQGQSAKPGKKRPFPTTEFVKDGPEGSKITKRSKKVAHNTVEKRYRMNLNSKIAELRESIPSLRSMKTALSDDEENGGGENGPTKGLRKAQVLSKANEYIHELELQARQLRNENEALKKKMALLRTVAASEEPDASPESFTQSPSPAVSVAQPAQRRAAKGFRPLAIQPAKILPTNQRSGKSNFVNKALMGCLAGLTVFEGMNDHNQGAHTQQGLYALPFNVLNFLGTTNSQLHIPGVGSYGFTLLSLIKFVLVWTTIISLLSPFILDRTSKSNKGKGKSMTRLHPAPPLASAVEVRQKAWLTSIQTVWVPRRNLILELSALFLKMLKIFARNVIGWKGYSAITGFTEEEEVARIKAWDIALDSQLTGGDPEICMDRLALTFLASLTLPTAPGRSAMKALHTYVLCKSLETKGIVRWLGLQSFTSSLATSFWSKAKYLNDSAHPDALPSEPMAESEVLPEHIKVLLAQPSEEIFTDDIKQRAYNMAYNKSTTDDIPIRDQGSEAVVTDFAIRSPLDALAAWWSSRVLRRALLQIIRDPLNAQDISANLALAFQSAPPRSGAQLRALVAIAAFQANNRKSNINATIEMMDIPRKSVLKSGQNRLMPSSASLISSASSSDVRIALRCAMLHCSLEDSNPVEDSTTLQASRLLSSLTSVIYPSDPGLESTPEPSLLGFATAYLILQSLSNRSSIFEGQRDNIEKLAASLRILIGGDIGQIWGLDRETVKDCVGVCLDTCKRATGINEDSDRAFNDQGYGSGVETLGEKAGEDRDEEDSQGDEEDEDEEEEEQEDGEGSGSEAD